MPTLAADLIESTRRHLLNGAREEFDILNGTITSGATTFAVTDSAAGIQVGTLIEIDVEVMYVRSIAALPTITVLRGQGGSAAAAHTNGAVITVNPKFPRFNILQELNNELADLSAPTNGLYRVGTLDLTWSAATMGYDLTGVADIEDVLDVAWQDYGSFKNWVDVGPGDYDLVRNMPTSEFASGSALIFRGGIAPGRPVRVRYKAPFAALSALTDDVQTVTGLPATANDIPPLGAAARMKGASESRRTLIDTQGDPKADDDVPPGANFNSARWFAARRAERINAEAARLSRDFPTQVIRRA